MIGFCRLIISTPGKTILTSRWRAFTRNIEVFLVFFKYLHPYQSKVIIWYRSSTVASNGAFQDDSQDPRYNLAFSETDKSYRLCILVLLQPLSFVQVCLHKRTRCGQEKHSSQYRDTAPRFTSTWEGDREVGMGTAASFEKARGTT
jgi:hypothetical protein